MSRLKILRFSIIIAVMTLSVLRGYGSSMIFATPAGESVPMIKGNTFLESKGLIEPAVEIGTGGSFQHSFHKLKKFSGNTASLSVKLRSGKRFAKNNACCFSEFLSVPRYLFNRSILI